MAKWYGIVGFSVTEEYEPGCWEPKIVDRPYFGDIINTQIKRENSGEANDDVNLSDTISIISDPFAIENCSHITYVEVMGTRWKVTDIKPQFPRLVLTCGGVYNGPQIRTAKQT